MTTWDEFKKTKEYPKLENEISVDVAIVGGGITGLLNAYTLSKAGKSVALLERDELFFGATGATTAFITKVIDTPLSELISLFGMETAVKVFESGDLAITELERIAASEGIECEFVHCENYIFASTEKQREDLKSEAQAYARAGIDASLKESGRLPFPNYGSLVIPDQAKFHVYKFLHPLAEKIAKRGVHIFEHSPVESVDEGEPMRLTTPHGFVSARDVILATYRPFIQKGTHFKKGMYISYVYEVEVPKGLFPEALYEDESNPYYYFRIDRKRGTDHDRMIIGGEDHRAELEDLPTLADKSFKGLEEFLRTIMNGRPYKIVKKWKGPILEPSLGLALIGKLEPHLYVATAFSGNGMTYGAVSALLLRDLILGKENPWTEVYDPLRPLLHPKRLAVKAADYAQEFFQGAVKNLLKS